MVSEALKGLWHSLPCIGRPNVVDDSVVLLLH
jgi:hypothetical protein